MAVASVSHREPTLEDVFLRFTGRQIRDEVEGGRAQMRRMHMQHRGRLRH
ncbi:MAG: hypothetical protein AB1665_02970 [Candidatus Thermoplasmatota archaeon]